MSLIDDFSAALARAAPSGTLCVADGDRTLTCDLESLDQIGCAFRRLALTSARLAGAGPEQLRKLADELSRRLTYLLEPISPIEVDSQQCVVQMRSNPPQRHEGASSYYELLVRAGGELSLCRYEQVPGDARQAVPAQVTRQVLQRLAGDFAAVAP